VNRSRATDRIRPAVDHLRAARHRSRASGAGAAVVHDRCHVREQQVVGYLIDGDHAVRQPVGCQSGPSDGKDRAHPGSRRWGQHGAGRGGRVGPGHAAEPYDHRRLPSGEERGQVVG
jgi:hypothetical protein